jgi:hypothetical protein
MTCHVQSFKKDFYVGDLNPFDHGFTPLHYCLITLSFDFGVNQ